MDSIKKLSIGKVYNCFREGGSFEFDGNTHVFDDEVFQVQVLAKPTKVIADDGEHQELIPLPEHLANDKWYYVNNHTKGIRQWLNSENIEITEAK